MKLESNWKTEPSPRIVVQRARVRGGKIARSKHKAGKAHAYRVPNYASTGDSLTDAVRASVARDMLALIDSCNRYNGE